MISSTDAEAIGSSLMTYRVIASPTNCDAALPGKHR